MPRGKGRRKAYLMRIPLGKDSSGKQIYETKTLRMPKAEAEAYMAQRVAELTRDGNLRRVGHLTLLGFLERWLASPALGDGVKARTQADRYALVGRYIRGHRISGLPLRNLPALELQAFHDELLQRALSRGTVRNVRNLLRAALEQAIAWELVATNPVRRVKLPSGKARGRLRPLLPDEVLEVLRQLPALPAQQRALFHVLLTSGLRPGEALGLQWKMVDLVAGTLRVEQSLVRIRGDSIPWRLEEAPKNAPSRRSVVLTREAADDLVELRKRVTRTGPEDWVFCGRGGQPLHGDDVGRRWLRKLLRRAGVAAHHVLYDLRHTCATLLLVLGEHPKVVSERLGHGSITITMDTYSSVLPTMQAASVARLSTFLYGSPRPPQSDDQA